MGGEKGGILPGFPVVGAGQQVLPVVAGETVEGDEIGPDALVVGALIEIPVVVLGQMLDIKFAERPRRKPQTGCQRGVEIVPAQTGQIRFGSVVGLLVLRRKEGGISVNR